MNDGPVKPDPVRGERDTNSIGRLLSAQSRASNFLAVAFMSVMGLGALTWYYANTLSRQGRAKEHAQAASVKRAQGDLPLPSLGRVDPPAMLGIFEPTAKPMELPSDREPLNARTLQEIPVAQNVVGSGMPSKTPDQLALDRQLSGAVFARSPAMPGMTGGDAASPGASPAGVMMNGLSAGSADLATLLRPTATTAVSAKALPAQRLLLPKGAFIDCTLETAIDSTLPGMTTCITATDTFGVDGKVVLLERGTKLVGETRGEVRQGAARVFVVWAEARTPDGVLVPLDSPGTDELGRSGLPGEVNTHFWERFGAALLVSVIDGAVQAGVQSSRSGGAVIVNPGGSQDVMTEILKNTINIPATVVKRNGDRIQVLVARDLDFRSVYELKSVTSRR